MIYINKNAARVVNSLWYFRSPLDQKKLGNIRFLFQIFGQKLNNCHIYDRI